MAIIKGFSQFVKASSNQKGRPPRSVLRRPNPLLRRTSSLSTAGRPMKAQWPLYQATPLVATSPNPRFIKAATLSSYPTATTPMAVLSRLTPSNGHSIKDSSMATLSASSMATLSGFQGRPPGVGPSGAIGTSLAKLAIGAGLD